MYNDILSSRYANKEVVKIFSDDNRYKIWRKLWLSLAKNEKELGLNISQEQLQEMENNLDNIDFKRVAQLENELQHDVMAHLHHFGEIAPLAKPIMHLGATSEFIKDNCDLIIIKDSLKLIKSQLLKVINDLAIYADEYKNVATLAYTHYQVAQPTSVGKRACLWLQSFLMDFHELEYFEKNLRFRGIKGTTGTLASFKELFNGDYEKVKTLNTMISKDFDFENSFIISGQTYDRKLDVSLLNIFSSLGVSAHKMTNDIRLLQNLKEIEEGFGKKQVGSSAMPYKKNPIKCERISSLAKYLMVLPNSANLVASTQWLERTLDDSANRRLTIPQGFFTTSSILDLLSNVITNLVVNKLVINKNLNNEIPFLATENIMMEATKNGGDRQELHGKIRDYAIDTKKNMVEKGLENNLLEKIKADKSFNLDDDKLNKIINVDNFIGFAKEQVEDFLNLEVYPIIKNNL
jgi:adenylosuccinate lyase